MLVKCICTNCAGHLEFEEENAGESIDCPHCGFETKLFLPGTQPDDPELLALIRRRQLRRRILWGSGTVLVLAAGGYALYRWGVPWIEDLMPSIETTTGAIVVLVLLLLAVPFALGWLAFPLLVLFELRKQRRILSQIASSLEAARQEESAPEPEPVTQEEFTVAETETEEAPAPPLSD